MIVEGCCCGGFAEEEDGGVDVETEDDEAESSEHVSPDVAGFVVDAEDTF